MSNLRWTSREAPKAPGKEIKPAPAGSPDSNLPDDQEYVVRTFIDDSDGDADQSEADSEGQPGAQLGADDADNEPRGSVPVATPRQPAHTAGVSGEYPADDRDRPVVGEAQAVSPPPAKRRRGVFRTLFAVCKVLAAAAVLLLLLAAAAVLVQKLTVIEQGQAEVRKEVKKVREDVEAVKHDERLHLMEDIKRRVEQRSDGVDAKLKELSGHLQSMKAQLDALPASRGKDVAAAPDPAVQQAITGLQQLTEKVNKLQEAAAAWKPADVKPLLDKLETVERNFSDLQRTLVLTQEDAVNLQPQIRNLFGAIQESHGRPARKEVVMLVLFHSSRLDIRPFTPVVQEVVDRSPYRYFFKDYVLGVALARNGVVEEPKIWGAEPGNPDDLAPFKPRSNAPSDSSGEEADRIAPEAVFGKRLETDYALRLVMVCSIISQPPDLGLWRNPRIQVYAILINASGQRGQLEEESLTKWQDFCAATSNGGQPPFDRGEAALITYRKASSGPPVPDNALRQFNQILRMYLSPVPPWP